MLSRRNIRVKVMQVLYAMSRDQKLTFNGALKRYNETINKSFELYLFTLMQFIKVAEYANKVATLKSGKLLPTAEDKAFTPKLFENPLVQAILNNPSLKSEIRKYKISSKFSQDIARSLYIDFAKNDAYKDYLKQKDSTINDHRQILLQLYKSCQANEIFSDTMEDNYLNWIDDKSLVIGAMKKTVKGFPSKDDFFEAFRPTDETTKEFGEALLQKVNGNDKELLGFIEPTLKNWDADRVAVIDMILLKMALSELIYFPTIPTKVTLNEFVEISKLYSTDKSKDFINGILDRLMKKLNRDGKITKTGRGLIE